MNLNITMGQYYPVDSFVHRLDPRTKILLTILMIVAVFMVHSLIGYALVLAFLYWAAKCSNVPFKMLMKGIKPLRIILILTFVLNLFSPMAQPRSSTGGFPHHPRRADAGGALLPAPCVPRPRDLADDADDLPHRALRRH